MASMGAFGKFGSSQDQNDQEAEKGAGEKDEGVIEKNAGVSQTMMQAEERNIGAVTWDNYKAYIKAAGGEIVVLFLIFSLLLMQGSNIVGSHWAGGLSHQSFSRNQVFLSYIS